MINLSDFMNEAEAEEEGEVKEEPGKAGEEITFQLNCDQCDFNSTELANLTKHMAAENHFPPSDPLAFLNPNWVDQGTKFECDSCKREFKSKHGLAIHTAKSHVIRREGRQKLSQGSRGKVKNFLKQNLLPDISVKRRSETIFDPLDALINRHMQQMKKDIVRIGTVSTIGRVGALDRHNARWDNTVPVPARLFKEANSI